MALCWRSPPICGSDFEVFGHLSPGPGINASHLDSCQPHRPQAISPRQRRPFLIILPLLPFSAPADKEIPFPISFKGLNGVCTTTQCRHQSNCRRAHSCFQGLKRPEPQKAFSPVCHFGVTKDAKLTWEGGWVVRSTSVLACSNVVWLMVGPDVKKSHKLPARSAWW